MQSRFDKIIDRRNTGCMKWDVAENELPMWVADMDFQTAPEITETIIQRARHGVFGYTLIMDEWYQSYQDWWSKRHSFEPEKGVADFLYRRSSGNFQYRAENDYRRGECGGHNTSI